MPKRCYNLSLSDCRNDRAGSLKGTALKGEGEYAGNGGMGKMKREGEQGGAIGETDQKPLRDESLRGSTMLMSSV